MMEDNRHFRHIPHLPRNEEGPLFGEPWHLTSFGMVLELHRKGNFQWREWVNYLSAEIALGKDYGTDDHGSIYYHQWVAALERLVTDKQLSTLEELTARKEQWRHADEHRPFGAPLTLDGQGGHHHDHSSHDHQTHA